MTTFKKLSLVFMVMIGSSMLIFTSNNLGDIGNKIMHVIGTILLLSGIIILFFNNSTKKQEH